MITRVIPDKKTWEMFLTRKEIVYYPFFQSWNFGEVQKNLGFHIERLGIYEKEKLVGVCQIIEVKARRGHYLHLRHGPVFLEFNPMYYNSLLRVISEKAKKKGAAFIRMSPQIIKSKLFEQEFKKLGFRNAPIHNMDAQMCWVLDITPSEEQLLMNMRKSHRYLVRKALSLSLKLIRTTKDFEMHDFIDLYNKLAQRKHFVPHRGVIEEFNQFTKDNQEELFKVYYQKKLISAALIAFVSSTAIYRHSASDDAFKNIPAAYLIQWEAIKEAKSKGLTSYNFWGIEPTMNTKHPWYGLSLFKTGFGGEKIEYIHAQDLPLSLKYYKTYLIDLATKKLKGY